MQEIKEQILVQRLKDGDRTAFELLFHFYYPGLVIYSTQFMTDRSTAEEIVQDFFVRLWEKRQNIHSADSLKSYFFTSIRNSSLNYLKHKKIESGYINEITELSNNNLLYDPDLYIVSELQEKIDSAINDLPKRCKEIFVMSRFKGLSNDEIATELSLSKRTVETQISNAIKILRVELKEYLEILILLGVNIFF